jgi:hypothetical protein
MTTTRPYRWAAWALALGALDCSSHSDATPTQAGATPPASFETPVFPFEPLTVMAYTSKVKTLLTGLALTEEEAEGVSADPAALQALIDVWMTTPAFRQKLIEFFKQAFQQTQVNIGQFDELLGNKTQYLSADVKANIVRSTELSFPLTALALIDEGTPFTDVATTDRFMLNPPLMSLLTYIDNIVFDDQGQMSSWLPQKFGDKYVLTLHYDDDTALPLEESIDPDSPNFLHFYAPCPLVDGAPRCEVVVVDSVDRLPQNIWNVVFGRASSGPGMIRVAGATGTAAPPRPSLFDEADWNDWRMIRIRRPEVGEDPSLFWDLPAFRDPALEELVLRTERVGFMTSLAFFANWPTNLSNLARATVNQSLIVALGYSLADSNAIVPISETGNPDGQHSQPGTTCYGCHQTLDPMRNFFRQSYSVSYHEQTSALPAEQQQAKFILDGRVVEGSGVRDFAQALAEHPRFAPAWTQKLCQFANSLSCDEEDPEFIRVAAAFEASGFDFERLVRELFSSPLVTHAAPTETTIGAGGLVTIARRDHFCAALEGRLGLADPCDLESIDPTALQNLAFGVPGAGYTRGASSPLLPREPNLFFSSALEGLCERLAERVIDPAACSPGRPCFRSAEPEIAIERMVRDVMGLPSHDARFADVQDIVRGHYEDALREGNVAADALASAFVLACNSPTSSAIGL